MPLKSLEELEAEDMRELDEAYEKLEAEKQACKLAGHIPKYYDGEGSLVCICDIEDK